MTKKMHVVFALAALALVLGGGWYASHAGKTEVVASKSAAPVPVTIATARQGEMPVLLNIVGRAEAYAGVTLKSRLDGQVLSVAYTEGQTVRQGEVLLQLDPADFAARVKQAEAVVTRDEAQLAKARSDVERYLGLKARGFVSDEKVNEIRTSAAAAAATLQADQAALELARLQLSYTTVRAPFAGVLGARLVFPGSSVKINDTALAVVNRVHPLYVSFNVPERHLPALRQAMSKGPMPVQVSLPGGKSAVLTGQARFIDNAVDPATGTILLKALLDNRDSRLTPGQFLNVSMILEKLPDAVIVPNEAIQQGAEGNFLYVVKADDTVEMRKIVVAASHQGASAIAQGVAPGETVVTDGQLRLTPGATVRANNASPAATTAPVTPAAR